MIDSLIEGVQAHLNALQVYATAGDNVRALGEAEHAKRVLQELYCEVWARTHTSGTGGSK